MWWQTNISWVATLRGSKWVEHVGEMIESGPDTDWSIGTR